jgi:hypothetical protein
MPDIESLAIVDSVWSGVLVLVDANQVESVRAIVAENRWVRVEEGGYHVLPG